jgi:Lhr-like helicase
LQDPPKIQVLIPETKETVTVSANQPYRRVEMYEADLKYSASDTNNVFTKQHVGDKSLRLSGESWKIVAITSNSVTLSNLRSSKRETKEWNGGK